MSLASDAAAVAVTALDTLLKSRSLSAAERQALIAAKKVAAGKAITAAFDARRSRKK